MRSGAAGQSSTAAADPRPATGQPAPAGGEPWRRPADATLRRMDAAQGLVAMTTPPNRPVRTGLSESARLNHQNRRACSELFRCQKVCGMKPDITSAEPPVLTRMLVLVHCQIKSELFSNQSRSLNQT